MNSNLPQRNLTENIEAIYLRMPRAGRLVGNSALAYSFAEAERVLARWSIRVPASFFQISDPVDFEICYGNGFTWRGKFRLEYGGLDHHDRLFHEAVRDALQFASGRAQPAGMSSEAYLESLKRIGDGTVEASNRILAECSMPDLGR